METKFESFPQPETLKVREPLFTLGMNKSKRGWKVGLNRQHVRAPNHGRELTWEEKKKRQQSQKQLREQLRQFKAQKAARRKEAKEARKQRQRQKEYNEIKSGKFEVIKNTKKVRKWSKKLKSQLVKLPAEVFESIVNK